MHSSKQKMLRSERWLRQDLTNAAPDARCRMAATADGLPGSGPIRGHIIKTLTQHREQNRQRVVRNKFHLNRRKKHDPNSYKISWDVKNCNAVKLAGPSDQLRLGRATGVGVLLVRAGHVRRLGPTHGKQG